MPVPIHLLVCLQFKVSHGLGVLGSYKIQKEVKSHANKAELAWAFKSLGGKVVKSNMVVKKWLSLTSLQSLFGCNFTFFHPGFSSHTIFCVDNK